jgi:hypothetical protein
MILKELKMIPCIIEDENPRNLSISNLYANKLSPSSYAKESWMKQASWVASILNELKVEYVLIKYLDLPYAYMQDIDLLVEKKEDRHVVFSVLRQKGFIPYRSLLAPNPEKIEFVKYESRNQIQVDIYPEPSWWKISYAPKGLISSTRIEKEFLGAKAYFPSPTYDIYIIITHSYAHGIITLGELAHVIKLILNHPIKWSSLLQLAKQYKLEHSIYLYLMLINQVLKYSHIPQVQEIQEVLKEIDHYLLSRKFQSYASKFFKDNKAHFPIKIPNLIKSLSALHEIIIGLWRNEPSFRELTTYYLLALENYITKHREVVVELRDMLHSYTSS